MGAKLYKAKAPGSLMLMGEHAVLHGRLGIASAINKFITVTLEPRDDDKIIIDAGDFGQHSTDLTSLKAVKPFKFVLVALQQYATDLDKGCNIKIESEIIPELGLGSSAAITIATLAAIRKWQGDSLEQVELLKQSRLVIRTVQKRASGNDAAASIFGGVVAYRADPLYVKGLVDSLPVTVVYSGMKTPTVEVIEYVEHKLEAFPTLINSLFEVMDECAIEAMAAIKQKDWRCLGGLMNIHEGLQDGLGVNNRALSMLVSLLQSHPDVLGAKISGSGLGDCVIALGEVPQGYFPVDDWQRAQGIRQLPIKVSATGVTVDEVKS